ncbi:hypothetical protein TEA_014560 [Camellia sinensis var. sinensis]|uniref:Bulb-type lectin domain-containing protein n=1 Tax=Camellia sinensis var. sinensis TaxID=542762 RepID=A0A4V3WNN3_CAMSN|nr:hypothetical protein TEA_014560 [Camellia sinensis var. sinensis]
MAPPMGLSCTICYHFGAVIIFFIASVPFFNNAQFAPPMANLSTIWINKPAIDNSFNVFSPSILNPVLETSSSNGSQMICGFYCPSTQQTQPSSCLFGVVILRGKRAYKWNLILHDSDGTFVWSTNTSGKFVFGLNFTELGNLVFFGRNNATVWQSFDHPTDSLLVGQTFFPGKKLTSSTSASNWTTGLFSLKFHEDNSLVAYVESNPPLPYFESHSNVKYVKFENENFNGQLILAASSSLPQFIRLDPDGHLKAYEWTGWNWNAVADLLTLSMVFSFINNDGGFDNITVFLKVQKSPTAEYLTPSPTYSPQKQSRHVKIILGSSLGAFFSVLFVVAFYFFLFRNKGESDELDEFFVDQVPGMPTRFSYKELRVMTSNFNNKLGEGGFGFWGRASHAYYASCAQILLSPVISQTWHSVIQHLCSITLAETRHPNRNAAGPCSFLGARAADEDSVTRCNVACKPGAQGLLTLCLRSTLPAEHINRVYRFRIVFRLQPLPSPGDGLFSLLTGLRQASTILGRLGQSRAAFL